MIFLSIFFASLATTSAYNRPIDPRLQRSQGPLDWKPTRGMSPLQGETVIENKNVNIIVNVDPKDVARELWLLIQARFDDRSTRRSSTNEFVIDELEKIITPLISPSRRSQGVVIPAEVAQSLARVTRQALQENRANSSSIDNEIDVSDIVARMMSKLKVILEAKKKEAMLLNPEKFQLPRGLEKVIAIDNSDNSDVVKITLHIKKSTLLGGNVATNNS